MTAPIMSRKVIFNPLLDPGVPLDKVRTYVLLLNELKIHSYQSSYNRPGEAWLTYELDFYYETMSNYLSPITKS